MSAQVERASRPVSLLLEGTQPEREPLQFDVQLVGAPPEVEQLVNNIKQVAEDFLYHWKTFPIGKCKYLFILFNNNDITKSVLLTTFIKCINKIITRLH